MQLIPGSRAPFSIELVSLALLFVIPMLLWSVFLVKSKKNFKKHKIIQLVLSIAILVVLVVFEIDIRLHGWRQYAEASPFINNGLIPFLYFHVTIACTATVLWSWALINALKRFQNPPRPGPNSVRHRKLGWAAFVFMLLTSVTGWTFFVLAFWL